MLKAIAFCRIPTDMQEISLEDQFAESNKYGDVK